MPSTRIERGPLTGQAVTGNRHQIAFEDTDGHFAETLAQMTIWLLLAYYDEPAEEIRLELSLPVEFTRTPKSERGYVTAFEPRLIAGTAGMGLSRSQAEQRPTEVGARGLLRRATALS